MAEHEIPTMVKITDEDVEDFLVLSFEGGSNYWIDYIEIDEPPTQEYKYFSEVITRGGTLKVYVQEEDEIFILRLENVLQAIADEQIDFDNYDGLDADAVVQRALFGEVVYG